MTRDDVLNIRPGDSVIGLKGQWDDEYPVVGVGALRDTKLGRLWRVVSIAVGKGEVSGSVLEGDPTIRGYRRYA